ncbi:mono/diheme cytochrome c family protein [Rhizobium azibense]|uniref:Mono/diheme cytochrome c family protein n=1 Tax=Rhizobium azibense TaxID=1136135 RepID=A0A4R3RY25_9HYPH|nr:cytochrome c [Rhizobium azibense]TCU30688.1 mono/diheme cytochrome c family protein [Rhizobium azibense]TCU41300.1 mono/diheme cytochrome c family protein [Rhizobium azibense]
MRAIRLLSTILTLFIVFGLAFFFLAWRPEIEARNASQAGPFDNALIAKGASLAAVGNCIACHTVPGKQAFSGGLKLPTPFGTIYSTNITPDDETGIGRWSEAAFKRAMREGVDRKGDHLYPAFPYDHFTRVTDEDNKALYAFLMTRTPVRASSPRNELPYLLHVRPILAAWKLVFFDQGAFAPDPNKSEEWNRGAYLAEGLGHCGACHTPRNAFGAEERGKHFGGGEAEGWQAYAINAQNPSPIPWDKESLAFYLRHGYHVFHGVSRGPMAEVTGNLGVLPDSDINAIAAYVASIMGEPSAERLQWAEKLKRQFLPEQDGVVTAAIDENKASAELTAHPGAAIYGAACATCHESGRAAPFGGLNFNLSTAVNAPNPQNIVNVVLFGLPPADGEPSAVMPGFAGALNDQQIADLLDFMRQRFTTRGPWPDLLERVNRTRSGECFVAVRPSDGIERAPSNVGAKEPR